MHNPLCTRKRTGFAHNSFIENAIIIQTIHFRCVKLHQFVSFINARDNHWTPPTFPITNETMGQACLFCAAKMHYHLSDCLKEKNVDITDIQQTKPNTKDNHESVGMNIPCCPCLY